MRHEQLMGSGRLPHDEIDNALAPSWRSTNPDGRYGWEDLRVSAASLRLPASSAPTWTAWLTSLQLPAFSNSGGEYVHFETQMPHGMLAHTANQSPSCAPYWHVHFVNHAGAIGSGETVTFRLTYSVLPLSGGATSTRTVNTTYTAPAEVAQNGSRATTDVSLDTTLNYGLSTIIVGRVERIGGTYTGDVLLSSTDFHVKMYRLGSASIGSG